MDVNNASLYGDLDEKIHMKPPQGLSIPSNNTIYELRKSLYELKQALRQWYAKLPNTFRNIAF